MIKLDTRKYDKYVMAKLYVDSTLHDLGMLTKDEAKALLEDFKAAVEELEWILDK
jgi:hypothetical protein